MRAQAKPNPKTIGATKSNRAVAAGRRQEVAEETEAMVPRAFVWRPTDVQPPPSSVRRTSAAKLEEERQQTFEMLRELDHGLGANGCNPPIMTRIDTWTFDDLFTKWKKRDLVLPVWQRRYRWPRALQQEAIATVLEGSTLGVFKVKVDERGAALYQLMDGQHRILTLLWFMTGLLDYMGVRFSELPSHLQRRVRMCTHPVQLFWMTDEQARKHYRRIQLAVTLTSGERALASRSNVGQWLAAQPCVAELGRVMTLCGKTRQAAEVAHLMAIDKADRDDDVSDPTAATLRFAPESLGELKSEHVNVACALATVCVSNMLGHMQDHATFLENVVGRESERKRLRVAIETFNRIFSREGSTPVRLHKSDVVTLLVLILELPKESKRGGALYVPGCSWALEAVQNRLADFYRECIVDAKRKREREREREREPEGNGDSDARRADGIAWESTQRSKALSPRNAERRHSILRRLYVQYFTAAFRSPSVSHALTGLPASRHSITAQSGQSAPVSVQAHSHTHAASVADENASLWSEVARVPSAAPIAIEARSPKAAQPAIGLGMSAAKETELVPALARKPLVSLAALPRPPDTLKPLNDAVCVPTTLLPRDVPATAAARRPSDSSSHAPPPKKRSRALFDEDDAAIATPGFGK